MAGQDAEQLICEVVRFLSVCGACVALEAHHVMITVTVSRQTAKQ